MAITGITAISGGDSRSSSAVRGNFKKIRQWLNGAVTSADVADGSVRARHIFKAEHYPGPLSASLCTTGDVYFRSKSFDKANRNYHFFKFTGGQFAADPNLAATIYLDSASNVEVVCRFFAWGKPVVVGSNVEIAYWGVIALAQLFHGETGTPADDTAVEDSKRRIAMPEPLDASTYAPAIYTFDKRAHSISATLALGAGYHHIYLAVRCFGASKTAPRDISSDGGGVSGWNNNYYSGVVIEGRSFLVEVHNK